MYDFFKMANNAEKSQENDGFYESYFKVFNLLKQKDDNKTPFNENSLRKQTNFFGAFINVFQVENDENIKCGIPNLIFKTDNKQLDKFKETHKLFSRMEVEEIKDEKNQLKGDRERIPLKQEEKLDNHLQLRLDFSLKFDDLYYKTAENSITLTRKIFENYPSKRKYTSLIEESLLFTPFSILNYDIALQKNVDNLVYQLRDFITTSKIWKNILCLIQGIPSELFIFEERSFSFIQIDKQIRIIGCLPKITENFLKFFIDFGNKLRIIQSVVHYYLFTCENCPMTLRVCN